MRPNAWLMGIALMAGGCAGAHRAGSPASAITHATTDPHGPRRFVVGVAALVSDSKGEMREFVIDELSKVHREVEVRRVEVGELPLEVDAATSEEGAERLRPVLAGAGLDLLVWGKVVLLNSQASPRLFLAAAPPRDRALAANHGVKTERYDVRNLALPAEFWIHLGDVLKLVVLAQASAFDSSRYEVAALRPFLERVDRLVTGDDFYAKGKGMWVSESRWEVLNAYATALRIIGMQTGDAASLEKSIASLRTALDDAPRRCDPPLVGSGPSDDAGAGADKKVPAAGRSPSADRAGCEAFAQGQRWATTQDNLGMALGTLGAREPGNGHLLDAVAAFHAALEHRSV